MVFLIVSKGGDVGGTVGADTEHLRTSAQTLAEAIQGRHWPDVDPDGVGSPRSMDALERFDGYWHPGRMALTGSVEALQHVLRSTADAYDRRDHDDAKTFGGAARAF
ncbi:hypothetical protein ACRAWC_01340 [Leifsonia sp. L25]|uniref:hypothetical protein n=1 Tax=Actinomycetes TaxID=1760 RepID=UPI003D693E30